MNTQKISDWIKSRKLLAGGIVIVILVLVFLSQSPKVISATVSPEVIVKGKPQEVTVMVTVKPRLFIAPKLKAVLAERGYKGSPKTEKDWIKYFSVFRLNPKTLGNLTKQGKDQEGNVIYQGKFIIDYSTAVTVQIQPTNIFGMNLLPKVTPELARLAITTHEATIPPNPGEDDKWILAGTDSNNDGLRDDLEREIWFLAPESARKREALKQYAKAEQYLTTATLTDRDSAIKAGQESFRGLDCWELNFDKNIFWPIGKVFGNINILDVLITNTPFRLNQHRSNTSKELTGVYPGGPFSKDPKVLCDIDPASLPD